MNKRRNAIVKGAIVVTVFILFAGLLISYFNAQYQDVVALRRERAKQVAYCVESHLSGRLFALKLLSVEPEIKNLSAQTIQPKLERVAKLSGFLSIAVFDNNGNIIAEYGQNSPLKRIRDSDGTFARVLKGEVVVSNSNTEDGLERAYYTLGVPVYSARGEITGAIAARLPLSEIADITAANDDNDSIQYTCILDSDGRYIYHPRLKQIYPENDAYRDYLRTTFKAKAGNFVYNSQIDQLKKLYVFEEVGNTNWRVVTVTPLTVVIFTIFKNSLPELLTLLLGLVCIYFLYRSLLHQRRLEQDMDSLRMERLASVNQLAAGLAHEIRNPLTSIKGFIQLIARKGDRPAPASYLEIIVNEIERIEGLINEFRLLARPVEGELYKQVNLVKAIADVVLLMESQAIAKNIGLVFKPLVEQCYVIGDVAQLKQVWINLLRNAIEAMQQGGIIYLSLFVKDDIVTSTVEDTGEGIPPEVLAKLGTPFFTTKEGGTGMGLSVCYGIIERHGGVIKVDSQLNKGTTFSVLLPLAGSDRKALQKDS